MSSVVTVITLIEAITVLTKVGLETINAIEKLKNGDPQDVDISLLKKKLLDLPDLTKLYPPDKDPE